MRQGARYTTGTKLKEAFYSLKVVNRTLTETGEHASSTVHPTAAQKDLQSSFLLCTTENLSHKINSGLFTKIKTMMRMNATTLVLALLLIIGGSAAEKSSPKIDVLEDELFWSRELQETMSVTVPPLPPPTPPSTPPPGTLPPSTPPPPLPPPETRCALEVSLSHLCLHDAIR
jgi:hypothetical protein